MSRIRILTGRTIANVLLPVRFPITLPFILLIAHSASAQMNSGVSSSSVPPSAAVDAEQTAQILGLKPMLEKLADLQTQRSCGSAASLEELTLRQELLESVQASVLDVDSVLAEISNERGELSNLRTSLQARRDRTVAKLNTAALITGSGTGAAVSATQFTTLRPSIQNTGDGIGIGAGVASTLLSILATRRQNGPSAPVGEIPNMLAPLFDRAPVLNAHYPPAVLQYLQSGPASEDGTQGTRLEQLKAQWVQAGRLNASDSVKRQQQVAAFTSSMNEDVKVTINDLTNRIAMLGNVNGRVSLIKRDLAVVIRSHMNKPRDCTMQTKPDQ